MFLDGARVAEGSGLPSWLAEALGKANVFSIGGDAGGENLAQGQFEELATFGYALTHTEVKRYYEKLWPTVQLGPLTPEEEKAGEPAWVMPSGESEQDSGGQYSEGIPDYGCGLWLEITATNAVATLTLHNTRSGAGYQILTNADLTTTDWSLFLTNVAGGSGYLTWTNIAINLSTNLFFRACETRDYVTNLVFQGLSFSNTAVFVPDSMGAVGPNHFVELLNNGIAVYDKGGALIAQTNSTNFFAVFDASGTNSLTGDFLVDPRILYDQQSDRWIACAIDALKSKDVVLAVSNGANPTNLTSGWTRYLLSVHRNGADTDFTTLGLDANGIYARVAHRSSVFGQSSTNAGHTVVAIKKPEIYSGAFTSTTHFLTNAFDFNLWTIQPAANYDEIPTNGCAWFIAKGPPDLGRNYQGGELYYRRLHWAGTNAIWADTNWIAVANAGAVYRNYYDLDGTNVNTVPSFGVVAPVYQGDVELFRTGSRLCAVSIRNQFMWTCQTVGLNGTNGAYSGEKSGTNVDRSAIQWFRIKISSDDTSLALADHGRILDSAALTNAWWYHYPSLIANCVGDMVAGFSGSSATNYIGAFYACRLANGGMLDKPRLLWAGTSRHSGDWGDYSATILDPTDDWSFWTVQAYSSPYVFPTVGRWSTVVAKLRPGP